MTTSDPCLWSATEQAAAIAAGRLGAVELLQADLARIERLDPEINAVVTLDAERALARAAEADRASARGESWGPLHGVSITVKDAIETAGIRSTGGAKALAAHVPERDAPVVSALKQAGAIVFGKTNLPEWSGDLQTYGELFGTCNNPWDTSRTTGGSSGGAAAAVACGMTGFEIGTDIGGSVRVPSAFCGVWGHKPSWGVIPPLGYLDAVGGGTVESDVNVFGPIARSAADLEVLLGVLAGPAPERALAWRIELPGTSLNSLEGLRVATWFDEPSLALDEEMAAALQRCAASAAEAGADVRIDHPPLDFAEVWPEAMRLIGEATSVSDDDDSTRSHREWLLLDRRRAGWREVWARFFVDVDVLLCPVTITPAFPHHHEGTWLTRQIEVNGTDVPYFHLEAWPAIVGAAYLPSTSTPVGQTDGGLPVGVQVVAPYLHDHRAIAAASLIADACGGGYRVPPLAA